MEHVENKGFHGYNRPPPLPTSSSGMKQPADTSNGNNDTECMVREQDRFMPIANVIRIMRKILPSHAKISDDAKETIQECVSEFISFITGEANDRCQREQRKTITAEDVLWAMSKLGFDEYIEPLTFYLNNYRDLEGDRGPIRAKPVVNRGAGPDPNGMTMGVPLNGSSFLPMGGYQYHQHLGLGSGSGSGSGGNGLYPQVVGYPKEASPPYGVPGVEHHGHYAPGNN